jgi:hypothetical protein
MDVSDIYRDYSDSYRVNSDSTGTTLTTAEITVTATGRLRQQKDESASTETNLTAAESL